jgi:hypothetical protein
MLDILVEEYLKRSRDCSCDDELGVFIGLSVGDAIQLAAPSNFGGRRHSHQRRLSESTLRKAEAELLRVLPQIRDVASFDALHRLISDILQPVRGAGPLYMYDLANRIGASLSLRPTVVYLHAGTREGARHLGVRGTQAPLSAFPEAIQNLTASQAEDFLCIFKDRLARAALFPSF